MSGALDVELRRVKQRLESALVRLVGHRRARPANLYTGRIKGTTTISLSNTDACTNSMLPINATYFWFFARCTCQ